MAASDRAKRLARLAALAAGALLAAAMPAAASEPPQRVVSMNLCTDQLAMLLAAPGQLYSVSHLAADPAVSAMAEVAHSYVINKGLAEDIFPMRPDLVLAGSYSTRATVTMLRRLGFHVEEFAPETSFADIRTNILRMGRLLGREPQAEAALRDFEDRLARYGRAPEQRPLAALYFANGYTTGASTLTGEIVERAGFRNLGRELGYSGMVKLPLETLVMSAPSLIVGGVPDPDAGLAYESFTHPALRAVWARRARVSIPDKYTICGTPFTAEAVRLVAEAGAPFLQ
jgi:iron complex transport system substrate-binding protein